MGREERPGAALRGAAAPGPVRLALAEVGREATATAGDAAEDQKPVLAEETGDQPTNLLLAAATELDSADRVASIAAGSGKAQGPGSPDAPSGFSPVAVSGSSRTQPVSPNEATLMAAQSVASAAPLAPASSPDGGKEGDGTSHGHLPADTAPKDSGSPATPLSGLHPMTVDPPQDNRTGSAAASSRPAGAELVTLPNLAVRLAQLAAGQPDRSPVAVRLRLDPPTLGEIRVQIESSARGIEVRIVAQSHEACALLADGQSHLRQELARHGMDLHSFAASVGDEGPNDRSASGRDSRNGPQPVYSGPTDTVPSPAAIAAPAPPVATGARGLDRRV